MELEAAASGLPETDAAELAGGARLMAQAKALWLSLLIFAGLFLLGAAAVELLPIWHQPDLVRVPDDDIGIGFADPLGSAMAPVYALREMSTGRPIASSGVRLFVDANGDLAEFTPDAAWDQGRLAWSDLRINFGQRFQATGDMVAYAAFSERARPRGCAVAGENTGDVPAGCDDGVFSQVAGRQVVREGDAVVRVVGEYVAAAQDAKRRSDEAFERLRTGVLFP
jgi:hypothetical protein